jgi:prolyl-tRNA synthetase
MISYLRTFERMGLKAVPMRAESGPIGGDLAHEFLVLAETGESEVFLHRDIAEKTLGDRALDFEDPAQMASLVAEWTSRYARTDDTHDQAVFEAEVPEGDRVSARGIEVGHIFYFGTKYSDPMNATVATPEGTRVPVHSGSYGIGVSRLVGAVIEASHDDKGIIWPESVAPFAAGIVNLKQGDAGADAACADLEQKLTNAGLDVLYDDTDERAGAKFATMELIGLPWRITVGPRGLKSGVVELTSRRTGETVEVSPDDAVARLVEIYRGL